MNIKKWKKDPKRKTRDELLFTNRLSSSVQKNGECVPMSQQSGVFKGWEGQGSRGPGGSAGMGVLGLNRHWRFLTCPWGEDWGGRLCRG